MESKKKRMFRVEKCSDCPYLSDEFLAKLDRILDFVEERCLIEAKIRTEMEKLLEDLNHLPTVQRL